MTKMYVLAINGSPRARESNTDKLVRPFLEGAQDAGGQCELIYAADLQVQDCKGCFSCWSKTPGECVQRDDMAAILQKIQRVDVMVWATPLYAYGMTARLGRIIERMLPLARPDIVSSGDQYSHPARQERQPSRKVLISNCGFPDRKNFDALVATFEKFTHPTGLAGKILCPMGGLLGVERMAKTTAWYTDAVRQAGREVVQNGTFSEETTATLKKPLMPAEMYLSFANSRR